MEGMPSTVAYIPEFNSYRGNSGIEPQRVLLFGSVRFSDPDRRKTNFQDTDQVFRHGRADKQRQVRQSYKSKKDYFLTSLGGGASSNKH